jgi:ABC-type lipoprotein release transport system permease subunit
MKLAEIFFSEDQGSNADIIKSEIGDLLFMMKNQGITEIETEFVIKKLHDNGIDIDKILLIDTLNDMPDLVNTATVEMITLKVENLPDATTDADQAQDTVAQAADSANPLT